MRPLEGRIIDLDTIEKELRKNHEENKKQGDEIPLPFLVLSHDDFNGTVWAITAHGYSSVVTRLKEMGFKYIVWAHDIEDNHFGFAPEGLLPEGIETLVLDTTR